jgi:hypothetical protein
MVLGRFCEKVDQLQLRLMISLPVGEDLTE